MKTSRVNVCAPNVCKNTTQTITNINIIGQSYEEQKINLSENKPSREKQGGEGEGERGKGKRNKEKATWKKEKGKRKNLSLSF